MKECSIFAHGHVKRMQCLYSWTCGENAVSLYMDMGKNAVSLLMDM